MNNRTNPEVTAGSKAQMSEIRKVLVCTGVFWVEIPAADIRILCGCPVDSVKHLLRRGLILPVERAGVVCETGPNTILLSDLPIQNGQVCSRSEFPVLQMLYKQGMLIPGHPGNVGVMPLIAGSKIQVDAQLEYLFRGNYGLVSRDELIDAGASVQQADVLMRMKLAFAFGQIRQSRELIQPVYLEKEAVHLRSGAYVRRLRTNVFEISYGHERVEVDLNLAPTARYECPYTLDMHLLRQEYFAVVHTGDGDGWDMNRPAMGSIVMFQGRTYLVDAGPNIDYALTALGIGLNEIDGIFHTHGHDDHLVGLTALMQCDRRIIYYAAPVVRSSVMKKLSAAMNLPEAEFSRLFDMRDLRIDEWNDIEGLEVRPILSPHPVETTVFQFRTMWEGGYRSYAHLADIASFEVLDRMLAADDASAGISEAFLQRTKAAYLEKADIKKVDIGGGMIHGAAADFAQDASGKLILAHIARPLVDGERAIGSGAPFGTVDVIIEGASEPLRRRAFGYLRDYFPSVPVHLIRHLLNGRIQVLNPQALLYRQGQPEKAVYLLLSGVVETIRSGSRTVSRLSAGSMLGESAALTGGNAIETCRAVSFVQVIRFQADVFLDFLSRGGLHPGILASRERMDFLRETWLFSQSVSCVTLSQLARAVNADVFEGGNAIAPPEDELLVIRRGRASHYTAAGHEEMLHGGDHFGATAIAGTPPRGTMVHFLEQTEVLRLPLGAIEELPIIRWKLIETHRRRHLRT